MRTPKADIRRRERNVGFVPMAAHKKKDRRAGVSLKCDWVFRSGGLLILRLRSFPNHQLKLMMTSITSKNTNLCVSAWLNLK